MFDLPMKLYVLGHPLSRILSQIPTIISVAEITNSDAIHPGYGFLSENSKFAKLCTEHNIKFIGPTAEMIDKMGDKSNAKDTMKLAGVPIIPGSDGLLDSVK
jgi:acetyl-CoA carboxylase, biotin carboxylase subunit